jgi:phage terminase Nu1 subunit (DNA packaging protein)
MPRKKTTTRLSHRDKPASKTTPATGSKQAGNKPPNTATKKAAPKKPARKAAPKRPSPKAVKKKPGPSKKAARKPERINGAAAEAAETELRPVLEQKEAARILGITDRALRDWIRKPGFPDHSAGYDIAAIRRWADARSLKNSSKAKNREYIEQQIQEQKLRLETAKADKAERENEIAAGNVLPRDEYETFVREVISVARDRLTLIPRDLCRYVPEKYHKVLQREGAKVIANITDSIAEALSQGPDGKMPDAADEDDPDT